MRIVLYIEAYLVPGARVICCDHVLGQVDSDALRDVGSEGLDIRSRVVSKGQTKHGVACF